MKRWFCAWALVLTAQSAYALDEIAPAYLQLLQKIVDINSDSHNVDGLANVGNTLIPYFEALGLQVTHHPLADGREVLRFETANAKPTVLLVGHLDTVFSPSSPFQSIRREGDRLMGPGVIDMKGGVVLMLNALEHLKSVGQLDNIRVVLNDDEEIGSSQSKSVLQQLAQGIPYGLVFEPGLEDGAVVSSQSGVRWIKLTTFGKAAHAGLEPENGIDACLDLATKITKLAALAEPEKGLLINPGVIEGGSKPNVVCEKASVTVDVRFQDVSDWERVAAAMETIRGHSDVYNKKLQQGTRTELVQLAEMPLLPDSNTHTLVVQAQEVAQSLGQSFKARGVGYGSDGNNLASQNISILVGLGPYGGGMHSDKEFMQLSSYGDRLALVTALIEKLNPPERKLP
ncbi:MULTISPECIES: M20 family metallopeptidase [unclassified Pseudomonas]|uniref:M20 family metallopeptidase n=1 Tax=unclassified Pseudomonas TaxID=196821 RepID=UPI002AC9914C|nr:MULTISPECIES: M20 family metallopeptidase [unclassified Pseudomonas]MEB0043347.1 M20 family metallopeptidase [Pseudomonas sp. MH10]MEB0122931.1 M20 family metallopeptidase [Pseudomonas sp. CCI1.2]WPX64049.1 M20 family metallopeptidase [Pseudomonas sp. MH10]